MGKFSLFREGPQTGLPLPADRRGAFFYVISGHWRNFLCYGLLMLAFCLPIHGAAVLEETLALLASAGEGSPEEIKLTIHGIRRLCAGLKIPGFALLAVPVAGLARVIRQYAWMERVDFWPEFAKGIRENLRHTLLLGLGVGILNFLAAFSYYTALEAADLFQSVVLLLPPVLFLTVIPVGGYMTVAISLYTDSFLGHLRTALHLYGASPWRTLLAAGLCLSVFAVQFLPHFVCLYFGRLVSSLLSAFVFLAWYLFALDRADALIHRDRFPELVGRGLCGGK